MKKNEPPVQPAFVRNMINRSAFVNRNKKNVSFEEPRRFSRHEPPKQTVLQDLLKKHMAEERTSDIVVLRVKNIKKRYGNIALLCDFVSFETESVHLRSAL